MLSFSWWDCNCSKSSWYAKLFSVSFLSSGPKLNWLTSSVLVSCWTYVSALCFSVFSVLGSVSAFGFGFVSSGSGSGLASSIGALPSTAFTTTLPGIFIVSSAKILSGSLISLSSTNACTVVSWAFAIEVSVSPFWIT